MTRRNVVTLAATFTTALAVLLGLAAAEQIKTFWALSDVHISDDYVSGSFPPTFCTTGVGRAGVFGTYNCDSPHATLIASAFKFMAANLADFIVWLGDSPTMCAALSKPLKPRERRGGKPPTA